MCGASQHHQGIKHTQNHAKAVSAGFEGEFINFVLKLAAFNSEEL